MDKGWIKLSRNINHHWIWKDPIKFQWWIDILLTVNYSDAKVPIGFKVLECKRGESLMSLLTWSNRWGVSKSVVNNFFTMLKKDNMIETKNETVTIRLKVCNYDSYQLSENAFETQDKRKTNARQTQDYTIKEEEESKERKEVNKTVKPKRFSPPTLLEVEDYCFERKNTVDASKFIDYYTSNGWKVGKNAMKDWRAAVRTWEKTQNNTTNGSTKIKQNLPNAGEKIQRNYDEQF